MSTTENQGQRDESTSERSMDSGANASGASERTESQNRSRRINSHMKTMMDTVMVMGTRTSMARDAVMIRDAGAVEE